MLYQELKMFIKKGGVMAYFRDIKQKKRDICTSGSPQQILFTPNKAPSDIYTGSSM